MQNNLHVSYHTTFLLQQKICRPQPFLFFCGLQTLNVLPHTKSLCTSQLLIDFPFSTTKPNCIPLFFLQFIFSIGAFCFIPEKLHGDLFFPHQTCLLYSMCAFLLFLYFSRTAYGSGQILNLRHTWFANPATTAWISMDGKLNFLNPRYSLQPHLFSPFFSFCIS